MLKTASVIILAGGNGSRFGTDKPKQFSKVAGKTVIEHTLQVFEDNPSINDIVIVVNQRYRDLMLDILLRNEYKKVKKVVSGGGTRQESSYLGLLACAETTDKVLIHDAVRPFLSQEIINRCLTALDIYDAVDVAIPASDTIIQVNQERIINSIPNRSNLMRGQTPQAFKMDVIMKAHELARKSPAEIAFTDDCGLVIYYKLAEVYVVDGDEQNIKITYPSDIFLADRLFQLRTNSVSQLGVPDLTGKVIVVFGHSSGIGEAIMRVAGLTNARTFGFSRSNGVDITVSNAVEAALARVYEITKRIDYVVNSAGMLMMGKLAHKSEDDIWAEIQTNYLGTVNVVRASIKYLEESKGSVALFTSSSYTRGRAMYSIYSSTKAAIVNLCQAVAEEVMDLGIRINVINPERTATPMRTKNFGSEEPSSLLSAITVAEGTLKTLTAPFTGQIIDIRR